MRIAVVTDIHGNLTAFEAVLKDLRETAPDLILHGGDLADSGSGPTEILDQIRDLRWPGVVGNTDEVIFKPESLQALKLPKSILEAIEEMSTWTRGQLGTERLAWLEALPMIHSQLGLALIHASPTSPWRLPTDADLETLDRPLVVYGHTHRPSIREVNTFTIANSGSVGQPHDGDQRASYVLVDDGMPAIRRVEYDLEKELQGLKSSGLPHAGWIARMLKTARPQMP